MGSGAVMYIPSFITVGLGIQKLTGEGIRRHADNMEIARLYVYFLQIKKVG
jgi:hypothetical protein